MAIAGYKAKLWFDNYWSLYKVRSLSINLFLKINPRLGLMVTPVNIFELKIL